MLVSHEGQLRARRFAPILAPRAAVRLKNFPGIFMQRYAESIVISSRASRKGHVRDDSCVANSSSS